MVAILRNSSEVLGSMALAGSLLKGIGTCYKNPVSKILEVPFKYRVLYEFIGQFNPNYRPTIAASLSLCASVTVLSEIATLSSTDKDPLNSTLHAFNEMLQLATFVVTVATAFYASEKIVRVQCAIASCFYAYSYSSKFYHEASYIDKLDSDKQILDETPYYLTDVTALLKKQGKAVRYIGREAFFGKLIGILKLEIGTNNPCLVGTAGSGKTESVHFLASEINHRRVPEFEGWSVYSTNSKMLMENTKFVGELQTKVNQMFRFLEGKKAILFIDEIHQALSDGKHNRAPDASLAEALLAYMTNPDIRIIAATTSEHYPKLFDNEPFRQRFEKLLMPRMTEGLTQQILRMHFRDIQKKFPDLNLFEDQEAYTLITRANRLMKERGLRRDIGLLHIVAERMERTKKGAQEILEEELGDYIEGQVDALHEKGVAVSDEFRTNLSAASKKLELSFGGENQIFLKILNVITSPSFEGPWNLDVALEFVVKNWATSSPLAL